MTPYFADAFYFVAMLNPRDGFHGHVLAFTGTLLAPMVTTAWVLTETADAMAAPGSRGAFLALLKELRDDPDVEILPPDPDLFERGLDLYARRPDKEWSLTDCISFVAMQERDITEALTGDHHFEQAGFRSTAGVAHPGRPDNPPGLQHRRKPGRDKNSAIEHDITKP